MNRACATCWKSSRFVRASLVMGLVLQKLPLLGEANRLSDHRMDVGRGDRDRLADIPMLDQLAVVQPEYIHQDEAAGRSIPVPERRMGKRDVAVHDDTVGRGDQMPDS